MMYVIVESWDNNVVVHGPFYAEHGARVYYRKLTHYNPQKSFKITHLLPEKNLSHEVASATPYDIMDVPQGNHPNT